MSRKLFACVILIVIVSLILSSCGEMQTSDDQPQPLPTYYEGTLQVPTLAYQDTTHIMDQLPDDIGRFSYNWMGYDRLLTAEGYRTTVQDYYLAQTAFDRVPVSILFTLYQDRVVYIPCGNWPDNYKDEFSCTEFPSMELTKYYVSQMLETVEFSLVYAELQSVNPDLTQPFNPVEYRVWLYRSNPN